MKLKHFSRILVLIGILIFAAFTEMTFQNSKNPKYEITASGVIQDKTENTYLCGSKSSRYCYARYLTIDNQMHLVTDGVYNAASIGDNVQLKSEVPKSPWQDIAGFLRFFSFIVMGIILCVLILNFVFWACFRSDVYTLTEYYKHLYG